MTSSCHVMSCGGLSHMLRVIIFIMSCQMMLRSFFPPQVENMPHVTLLWSLPSCCHSLCPPLASSEIHKHWNKVYYLFIYSLIHSFVRSFVCFFVCLFIYLFIYNFKGTGVALTLLVIQFMLFKVDWWKCWERSHTWGRGYQSSKVLSWD